MAWLMVLVLAGLALVIVTAPAPKCPHCGAKAKFLGLAGRPSSPRSRYRCTGEIQHTWTEG